MTAQCYRVTARITTPSPPGDHLIAVPITLPGPAGSRARSLPALVPVSCRAASVSAAPPSPTRAAAIPARAGRNSRAVLTCERRPAGCGRAERSPASGDRGRVGGGGCGHVGGERGTFAVPDGDVADGGPRGCSRGYMSQSLAVCSDCPRNASPHCHVTVCVLPLNRNVYASINNSQPTLF